MIDPKGQLIQSAKDMRQQADKQRMSMSQVKKQLDQVKQTVQQTHNHGLSAGSNEGLMYSLDRQVRDMQKSIDNLEQQARELDKQSARF